MLMTALHFLLEHGLADVAHVPNQKATVSEQMMQAGELNHPAGWGKPLMLMISISHLNAAYKPTPHAVGHAFALSHLPVLSLAASCYSGFSCLFRSHEPTGMLLDV